MNVADKYAARSAVARKRLLERLATTQSRTAQVQDASQSDWNVVTGGFSRSAPHKYLDSAPVKMAFVTGGSDIWFKASSAPDQPIAVPIVLEIAPTEAVPAANLVVIAGGVGVGLAGSNQTPRATKYLLDLPQIGWIERKVDVVRGQNGHIEEDFQLRIGKLNWGYLYAELEVIRDDEIPEYYSTIVYFASSEHRVLFSYGSLEQIVEFFSRRKPEINSVERKRMRERGEFSRITPALLKEPALPQLMASQFRALSVEATDPLCPDQRIVTACEASKKSVSGRITFKQGVDWPVSDAIVRLVKETGTDTCLAQTRTSDSGGYLFCLDDPGVAELSVVALASGEHAAVAGCRRSTNPDEDCQQLRNNLKDMFALRSSVFRFDTPPTNEIERDLPLDDQWNADAARALGIYEAVNLAHKALKSKGLTYATGGSMPAKVLVAYGNPSVGTSAPVWKPEAGFEEANIEVSFADQVDWDVIHHEFGHIVQHYGKLAPGLGGKHRLNVNLCDGKSAGIYDHQLFDHGKEAGTQLAWTEGWATWFSTWIQQSMRGRFDPDFTTVGDLIYENSSPEAATWGYDIESFDKYTGSDHFGIEEKWLGEGNEVAIQRFLWDVGDVVDTGELDNVALGHEKVWALTASGTPAGSTLERLSEFVEALLLDIDTARPLEARSSVGQLLAEQGVSPKVQPATFRDWLFGTSEITWLPQFKCTTANYGVTQFDLDFMDSRLSQTFDSKKGLGDSNPAKNGANSYALTSSDRDAIFGRFKGGTWTVLGTDTSDKKTGPYPSTYAKVHPPHIWWILLILAVLTVVVFLFVKANKNAGGT